jgi:hypothetical protein
MTARYFASMKQLSAGLEKLQRLTFNYFLEQTSDSTGLVADSTRSGSPSSIAAVGLGLTAYVVGAERAFLSREEAVARVLRILRFLDASSPGPEATATGYRGFYYHFLDMESGRRAWRSELSTIDSTYVVAWALVAGSYFTRKSAGEQEIRALADRIYRRVDWRWAQDGRRTITHGWKPERGFLRYRWEGYSEGLISYILGLGSPTFPLDERSYPAWTRTYRWKKLYGIEYLYAGPLFIHQLPQVWLDLRGIQDEPMRQRGLDYFENSGRAILVQQRYAIRNPRQFAGYGEFVWGITASDGPGPARRRAGGVTRRFRGYAARGVPYGPDDGTIAPWAVAASLPFAPELVLATLKRIDELYPSITSRYGFKCSVNPTFPDPANRGGAWVSQGYHGLDQGPVVSMIENYRSGLIWRLLRECPYIVTGLRRAGFSGGWLDERGE